MPFNITIVQDYCAQDKFLNGFHQISHFKTNDNATNTKAIIKIGLCATFIIPIFYVIGKMFAFVASELYSKVSSLNGRVEKKEDLSEEDKKVIECTKENHFVETENKVLSEGPIRKAEFEKAVYSPAVKDRLFPDFSRDSASSKAINAPSAQRPIISDSPAPQTSITTTPTTLSVPKTPSRSIAGVQIPGNITINGKDLRLNGAGLRTKSIPFYTFKVYTASLYTETLFREPNALISSDSTKSIRMNILMDLSGNQIFDAVSEGFRNNSGRQINVLNCRLQKLKNLFSSASKGDQIALNYYPGQGTTVTVRGQVRGIIEGKDFADALFSVWLGNNPVQADLKSSLLGR